MELRDCVRVIESTLKNTARHSSRYQINTLNTILSSVDWVQLMILESLAITRKWNFSFFFFCGIIADYFICKRKSQLLCLWSLGKMLNPPVTNISASGFLLVGSSFKCYYIIFPDLTSLTTSSNEQTTGKWRSKILTPPVSGYRCDRW